MLLGLVFAAALVCLLATRGLAKHLGASAHPVRKWLPWWLAAIIVGAILATARGYADNVGFPVHSAELEEAVFGSLPTVWLQDHLYSASPDVFSWAAVTVHASWFVVTWGAAAVVTLRKGDRVASFFRWCFGLYVAALAVFVLFPLEPPWMAEEGVVRAIASVSVVGEIDDPNPLAAMPSLHVAFPLMISLWFLREGWQRPAIGMLVYSGLVSFEVVSSGEHYVVDVVGGAALALVVALAARVDYAWLLSAVRWRPPVATEEPGYGPITAATSVSEMDG